MDWCIILHKDEVVMVVSDQPSLEDLNVRVGEVATLLRLQDSLQNGEF